MEIEVRTLAELLYVELVGRVMFPTGASTAAKPNPENLAKMCIKLATSKKRARKASAIAAPDTTANGATEPEGGLPQPTD